jgi:hypothetical protein
MYCLEYHPAWKGNNHEIQRWILANAGRRDASLRHTGTRSNTRRSHNHGLRSYWKITGRGHTVNQPLLTIHFSSPMENVIRVQVVHHKGKAVRKPEFTIHTTSSPQVSLSSDKSFATLTSGNLTVRVDKGNDWLV